MFKEVHVESIETHAGAPQIADLLVRYRRLSCGADPPSYSDFNPETLSEHASHLAVVDPLGGGDYLYTYYGRSILQMSGVEMLGSKVSQWQSEVGAFFCQAYDRACYERRPIYTVHRAHHAVRVHLWERLVLPVRTEGGGLRLLVFNKPREYIDDLLKAVLSASPEGVLGLRCVRNAQGHIEDAIVVTANERAADIIACPVGSLVDRPLLEVAPRLKDSEFWARCRDVVQSRRSHHFEVSRPNATGTQWFDIKAVPLGDGLVLTVADITGLKNTCRELEEKNGALAKANERLAEEIARRERLENELRRLADVDVLTGVATRRAFMDAAARAFACTTGPQPGSFAIILLDIDHFKIVNDRYGHLAGDKVLAAVGEEMARERRAGDIVGRLGGEEFGILLWDATLEDSVFAAERLRQCLSQMSIAITPTIRIAITASFGVAERTSGDSLESLFARADDGLYCAKRAGRDRVIASSDLDRSCAA